MRSISWKTYAAAFLISAFLFGFGILLGVFLMQNINADLDIKLQSLKGNSGEVELLLSMDATQASLCPVLQSQLSEFDKQTTEFGTKLSLLENTRGRTDGAVSRLKKEYLVQQVRDFLLVKRINTLCGTGIPTLLFFYTNDCPECTRQGLEGPPLKRERPDVMIYALDSDLQTPVVDALERVYGVKSYPTLVVNGKTYSGFKDKAAILSALSG